MQRPAAAIVFVLLSLCAASCMEMDSFLFNTEKLDAYRLPGNTIPDSLLSRVMMRSGEQDIIYGYWVASTGEHPGMAILYNHGNKHNIDEYWDRVMMLHRLGMNIFIYDYRGFGMSEGTSSEQGMFEDAEVALHYVRSRGISDDSLCLYGFSLGNVASIHLAATKIDPRCLIAESPFASANSLTQGGAGLDLPARWLTEGTFNNAETIRNVKTQVLVIHGEEDDFVRYRDNGRIVFANAPEPKRLVPVPGALHDNVPQTMGIEKYLDIVKRWIMEGE